MPTPSLLIVPARFKTGKMYSQIPTSGAGDFTVTRATTATRVNASGLIESVASGIPRLDYYTSGGVVGCPALLVEPSASNGILNSTDTATSWGIGANLTSGAIDVIGVTGNNLTVAVSGSGIGFSAGRIGRSSNNVALASGSTYTISFFIKRTGTHRIGGYYALITGGAAGDLGAGFNVSGSFSNGSIYNSAGTTNRIRRVEQWGTDVFRCSETFTMTASGTLTSFFLAPVAGVTSESNPAVGAQLGFAAPQIELGSVPTSFIPTTTGSITRNADVISVSGAVSGSIGSTEGTIYVEFEHTSNTAERRLIALSDGTATNRCFIWAQNNILYMQIRGSDKIIVNPIPTGYNKVAFAYEQNGASGNMYASLNGGAIVSGTSSDYFTADLNRVAIGNRESITAGLQWNNRIRAATLYPTRLTNAQLQALTT
jgi:hypothetical protein